MYNVIIIDDSPDKQLDVMSSQIKIKFGAISANYILADNNIPEFNEIERNYSHLLYVDENNSPPVLYLVDENDKCFKNSINANSINDKPCFIFYRFSTRIPAIDVDSDEYRYLIAIIDFFRHINLFVSDANLAAEPDDNLLSGGSDLLGKLKQFGGDRFIYTGNINLQADIKKYGERLVINGEKFIRSSSDEVLLNAILNHYQRTQKLPYRLAKLFNSEPGVTLGHGCTDLDLSTINGLSAVNDLTAKLIEEFKDVSSFVEANPVLEPFLPGFVAISKKLKIPSATTSEAWCKEFWQDVTKDITGNWRGCGTLSTNITVNTILETNCDNYVSNLNGVNTFDDYRAHYYKLKLSLVHDFEGESWLLALKKTLEGTNRRLQNGQVCIEQSVDSELFIPKNWFAKLFADLSNSRFLSRILKDNHKIGLTVKTQEHSESNYYKVALIINSSLPCSKDLATYMPGAFSVFNDKESLRFFYDLYFIKNDSDVEIFSVHWESGKAKCRKIETKETINLWSSPNQEHNSISVDSILMSNPDLMNNTTKFSVIMVFDSLHENKPKS